MNTRDLMNAVIKHESIIVTLALSQVAIVKSRLSNYRSRQQSKLEEFADDRRLDYCDIPLSDAQITEGFDPKEYGRLRISLVARTQELKDIVGYEVAEDF